MLSIKEKMIRNNNSNVTDGLCIVLNYLYCCIYFTYFTLQSIAAIETIKSYNNNNNIFHVQHPQYNMD